MPFKVWAIGEEVLAQDFNDYVQEQVVAVFATTAARDAAIIAPNEGQQAYVTATKRNYQWNGAAWVAIGVRSTARQQVIGSYDPNTPVAIHTAFLGITTDANGYQLVNYNTLNMPTVPVGILTVIPQVVSTWAQANYLSAGSSVTQAQLRFLTGAGAILGNTALNIAVTIFYQ